MDVPTTSIAPGDCPSIRKRLRVFNRICINKNGKVSYLFRNFAELLTSLTHTLNK